MAFSLTTRVLTHCVFRTAYIVKEAFLRSTQYAVRSIKRSAFLCVILFAIGIAGPLGLQAQTLEEGRWVGRMMHPTGSYLNLFFEVSNEGDSLQIAMDVPDVREFRLQNPQYDGTVIRFWWQAGVRLECAVERQDDGSFQGGCRDRWGGRGPLMMVPPGIDQEAVDINNAALFTDWIPPQDDGRKTLAELYDEESIPAGNAIDIGGYRLNVLTMGQGEITVVLEAGLGDDLGIWNKVQPVVANVARVVSYDRAGLGHSDPSPMARTPEQLATELHALLRRAGHTPPYVLVGHAEGAFSIRRFGSLYPDEVAGMVLVDASHEEQYTRWKALDADAWEQYVEQKRTLYMMVKGPLQAEYEAFDEVMEEREVPGLGALPDVPVVILTAMRPVEQPQYIGETEKGLQVKYDLHKAWADQTEQATHRVTKMSGPYIHREEPELVIQAIREVIAIATAARR